ncbi:M20/M25/M40 family metallo-hydrolase [Haloplanus pelagicus]|uniref:M20/M25/M40 family metallo-hydrolase n=1 Tax=Haloplanus pelagicus TaxID=2949995 RepID=UPI00203DF6F2|nr:M20/M25/M40 family metallo-hydrolase [Haloplanus sp. HW8-1]
MASEPIELLKALVCIESHESVDEIRDYLVDTVENASIHEESGCVVARKGATDGTPHVFLNSHMDVVTPHVPLREEDGVVYGRGSCDAKASLVTMIRAFERVDPTDGTVTLVVSPDEETYSEGLYDFLALEGEHGDMAINGEPTGLDVCNAARGSLKYIAEFSGSAAHAGTRESGQSAVSCAAEAVRRLESMDQMEDEYLGRTSQTVSWLTGGLVGELTSQVPERVRLFVNRWSVPPETPDDFMAKMEAELADLDCETTVRYPYRPNRFLESYHLDADEPVIQEMVSAVETVTGSTPAVKPFSVAAESSFFQRYMPVAVFGPGRIADEEGPIAHSEREYIETDEVETAVDVVERFLTRTV